jgi:hypothetical protein
VAIDGEFEVVKKVKDTRARDETDAKNTNDNRLFSGCRRNDISVKISRVTKGQIFGVNDILNNRTHSSTIKCVTSRGSLYVINGLEFISKLKKDKGSFDALIKHSKKCDAEERSKVEETLKQLEAIKT